MEGGGGPGRGGGGSSCVAGFTDHVVTGPVEGRLIKSVDQTHAGLFLAALCCFWLEEVYTEAAPAELLQLSVSCDSDTHFEIPLGPDRLGPLLSSGVFHGNEEFPHLIIFHSFVMQMCATGKSCRFVCRTSSS